MLPIKNIISVDRNSSRALFLQITDQIIDLIKKGILSRGAKLHSTRKLAEELVVHRKTVVMAYDDLFAQGWITTIPSKGTFVNNNLPIIKSKKIKITDDTFISKTKSNFSFFSQSILKSDHAAPPKAEWIINDGLPDDRLAPVEEISRNYRSLANHATKYRNLSYADPQGSGYLRTELSHYLNRTRGINISKENILITRGSQMGIYLCSKLLLTAGEKIAVGNTNYLTANHTFKAANGQIITIPVDNQGLQIDVLESLLQIENISAIYITSHHHHPTTVTLSAERRIQLIQLSQKHRFAIIEDDYDYDFHYAHAPYLPLASHDEENNVIYLGGFTKIVAPGFRIGFLVASQDLIEEATTLRRIIDRQGDTLLENVFARMLAAGDIERHCKKVLRIYKARRNACHKLLQVKVARFFEYEIPEGGMAFWLKLKKGFSWEDVYKKCAEQKLYFTNHWTRYDTNKLGHNGIRLGFASSTEAEMEVIIDKLEKSLVLLEKSIRQ